MTSQHAKHRQRVSELFSYLCSNELLHMAECTLPFWMYWISHLKYFLSFFHIKNKLTLSDQVKKLMGTIVLMHTLKLSSVIYLVQKSITLYSFSNWGDGSWVPAIGLPQYHSYNHRDYIMSHCLLTCSKCKESQKVFWVVWHTVQSLPAQQFRCHTCSIR